MFPSDWSDRKSVAVSKRRKVQPKDELKCLLQEAETASVDSGDDFNCIVSVIKRQVNSNKFAPGTPDELQLDHVLSGVPYQAMLESLFGGISGPSPSVPLVTKAFEEAFMREPGPGEVACSMGNRCECMFIDRNAQFIGVAFDPPGEAFEHKLCVLCSRWTTQKMFYDMCYSGKRVQGLSQRYGNLCNQPGEYARECMLISPPNAQWSCMPLPIMSHQRNRYRVQIIAGVKHLEQLRVSYEDFGPPSGKV
jgi:hypothetical protein